MNFSNHNIFITGAAGSIGSELVRQLVDDNAVFCLDINETELFNLIEELQLKGKKIEGQIGDVRDLAKMENYFIARFHPDVIFHCAALKHVTPCEWNPEEAVAINVIGTYNVIKLAQKLGSLLINISTDKAVNPKSVMGMTKRISEIMVRNAGFISVRFANVLGSRGSVIPIWQKQIDEGQPLTITHPEMERYFMTIEEAVGLIIKAADSGKPGDIIVLDIGKPIKIIELAKEIIRNSGHDLSIKEIGIRPGESMKEELMTEEERKRSEKINNFFVIHAEN